MAYTTDSAVRSIIETDSAISLTGFISAADRLTHRVKSNDSESTLARQDLEEIARWLAAHFYAHRDQLFAKKRTNRADAEFQGKTAMYLESTQYGQTAMLLDTTGYLAALNAQAKAGGKKTVQVLWLGTDDGEDSDSEGLD